MPQRLDSSCSCPDNDNSVFDGICHGELAIPITADTIINQSNFCISFQQDSISSIHPDATLGTMLAGLGTRVGLYHIWVAEDYCYEHRRQTMIAVYVGKGGALTRLLHHGDTKLPQSELFAVTFVECENRIAKYLEQLFLDTYRFELNKYENPGTRILYASWDEERLLGTELHNVANKLGSL